MDPRLAKMMRNLKTEEIKASEIIIKKKDGKILSASSPQITKMNAMGQEIYQVIGKFEEKTPEPEFSEEDVKLVMEKTGKERDAVEKALEEEGDIASAILTLSQ